MTRTSTLAILPFAWMMIGADGGGCDPTGGWVNHPPNTVMFPSAPATPALPYCNADPPVGCAAVCVAVDDVELTSACADIGASTFANKFAMDIQAAIDARHAKGQDACDASQVGVAAVTSCQDGLPPIEWPNQDHENCTPPPAMCIVLGSP